jgi:hypothetical protein
LGRIFQGGLVMLPGLIFPPEPVSDPMLAKQILDAISWGKTVAKVSERGPGILNSCLSELESKLIGSGSGTAQADFGARYRLPKLLGSPELVKWDTRGQTGLKNSVGPLATSQIVSVLNQLMNDLSRSLGIPCIDVAGLTGATESEPIGRKFVLVGASHVKRLKDVLTEMGEEVVIVESPHFRLMKTDVANLTASIKDVIGDDRENVVLVINVLDNTFFVAMSEDGHTCPIRKDITGKYHVDGDVVCAPVETSKRLFSNLFPLLQEFKDVPKLVLTPLPRYLYISCCEDLDHVPGLLLPGHIEGILDNLDSTQKLWRGMAFREKIQNTKICNVARLLSEGSYWGTDPVHPLPDGYHKVASYVLTGLRSMLRKQEPDVDTNRKRPREGEGLADFVASSAPKRPAWLTKSEDFVTRSERGTRGFWRGGGRRPGRGGNFSRGRGYSY